MTYCHLPHTHTWELKHIKMLYIGIRVHNKFKSHDVLPIKYGSELLKSQTK